MIETRLWRDEIRGLGDLEAEDFSRRLLATFGPDVSQHWQNVYVSVGLRAEWFDNYGLILIESRDV